MVKNKEIYLILVLLIILYLFYPNKIYEEKDKTKIKRKIEETNDTIITITTSDCLANFTKDNLTYTINLGKCEMRLKMIYNISINEALTIYINKITPEIEYEVYYNSKQLNMSYCKDIIIPIIYPTSINTLNISLSKNVDIINTINNLLKNEKNETQNKTKEEIIKYYDELLHSIDSYITSGNISKEENNTIITEKIKIIISSYQNDGVVNLNKCEYLLRKYYNISTNESLYMKILDVYQDLINKTKIEFDVYAKLPEKKIEKLNISICSDEKIYITKKISLKENIDISNISSGYYNDICYTATSESGTDIILNDRKKEYINKNKALCQENCVFINYDFNTEEVLCSCNVEECPLSLADMNINLTKLYENIFEFDKIMNINILKCYHILFSKKGILLNFGFYFLFFILLFHIICIIIFYLKQFNLLKNKIEEIHFALKHKKLIKHENKKNKVIKGKKKNNNNKNKMNEGKSIILKDNIDSNNNIILSKNKKRNKKIIENNKINKKGNNNKKNEIIEPDSNEELKNKIKNIMKYTQNEINELSYILALKSDKRSYSQFYISLLRTKHNFIFSFFYNNDYNSSIVKIDLFIISFTICYTINLLFYDDDTIHNIYETQGKFDIEYQLPKIIYSSLISIFLNFLLKLLALSHDNIVDFKNDKSKEDLNERKGGLEKKLNIKFILYFFIGIIILLFFWNYISMFEAIYKNTQFILLKDTFISFVLSLIYPFGIYLLPGIFRIYSLSGKKNKKKKRECCYRFSKMLQII